ncbi:hypothetical protein NRY95_19060 [Xanthomonas campestris pv. phormiicola]|nr:hypothetical protein [Xanthomonas campestris pv. phormiicola]UYC15767.1 hypothetical protein NRY95_19060 [Xanthomonas campestris pv. phormiicola]
MYVLDTSVLAELRKVRPGRAGCESVAQRCARLHVPDKGGARDALIAATALVHGMAVVTRNVSDFESTGVPIVNAWELSP